MNFGFHPDGLTRYPYQEVETLTRMYLMRAHLSLVLTGLILFGVAVTPQTIGQHSAQMTQSSTGETVLVARSRQAQRTYHRGSGRRVIVNG